MSASRDLISVSNECGLEQPVGTAQRHASEVFYVWAGEFGQTCESHAGWSGKH